MVWTGGAPCGRPSPIFSLFKDITFAGVRRLSSPYLKTSPLRASVAYLCFSLSDRHCCLLHRFFHYRCQRLNKQWRGVERFDAGELDTMFFGLLASAYLDIIKNFKVIRQELDRRDQHMGMTGGA